MRLLQWSRFRRYWQTVFNKLYKNIWCVYSTTTRFEIQPMSGNFPRTWKYWNYVIQDIWLFSIRLPIIVWNQLSSVNLALVTSLCCFPCFLEPFSWQKPVFHFWRQVKISSEISHKYASISGHELNFETRGGRVHPSDIYLQPRKKRLSLQTASQ